MKKSVVRQRKAEVLLLLISLVVLSVVYVGLLSSDYSAYLKEQEEHALTYEGNTSLPSVASSQDDTASAGEESDNTDGLSAEDADTADSSSADDSKNTDSASDTGSVMSNFSGTGSDVSDTLDSSDDSGLADADSSGKDSTGAADGGSAAVTYERTASGNAILLGDADMLSIYSYDPTDVTVCTVSGISAANLLAATFTVPEVSTKERTVEQILNLGDYDACYLFLGVHEAVWYYEDSFLEYYEALITKIQELAPDTAIYIHAIPSATTLIEAGAATGATDEHIAGINAKLKTLAAEFDGVVFVEL